MTIDMTIKNFMKNSINIVMYPHLFGCFEESDELVLRRNIPETFPFVHNILRRSNTRMGRSLEISLNS